MKSFKEVEKNRVRYHKSPEKNSVHRASLMVPELPHSRAEISFLNHFLIKRGYTQVGCKITGIAADGAQVDSRLFPVTEPRVYRIPLTGLFESACTGYIVEFFSGENLFIPFPAVMVNHVGDRFLNTVHSYNRPLNDVFENDVINQNHRPEASIDVHASEDKETFLLFASGPQDFSGTLQFLHQCAAGGETRSEIPLTLPRFNHAFLPLSRVMPNLRDAGRGTLKVVQPEQFLFYGRMFVGAQTPNGEFSANHSYYDCSGFEEYWDSAENSYRNYPYLAGRTNRVRMYPIFSPSALELSISLQGADGRELARAALGELRSPGGAPIDLCINDEAKRLGVDESKITAFAVILRALDGRMPTRTNHQLIYSRGDQLESSINISLNNPNVFMPPNRKGFTWAQLPIGGEWQTTFGLVGNSPHGEAAEATFDFYSENGHELSVTELLPSGGAIRFDLATDPRFAAHQAGPERFFWVVARSARPDLSLFTSTSHARSQHCTGEHGF